MNPQLPSVLRPAVVLFGVLTLITGVLYPLIVTGAAQTLFPHQADGSLVGADGTPVLATADGTPPVAIGSALIGQDFSGGDAATAAGLFWSRPSATSPVAYTAFNADKSTGSSGSNLAALNPAFIDGVKSRIDALAAADTAAGYTRPKGAGIPVDLVTASASGLDPDISPAAAEYQVPRVAKARGLSEDTLREVVARHIRSRAVGLLGEPVVNVLRLNIELAKQKPGQ